MFWGRKRLWQLALRIAATDYAPRELKYMGRPTWGELPADNSQFR